MTEITINLDHSGRMYVVRFNIRTQDDDDIVRFAEVLQSTIFAGLQTENPTFDGPVPSVAFAHWINNRLLHIREIESIAVGVLSRISFILREPMSGRTLVSAGDAPFTH